MSKMSDIQKKIEEALASVDNIERASPKPFFYTRLEARLARNGRTAWDTLSHTITRPAFAISTLALVIILNVAVIVQGMRAVDTMPDLSEMASTDDLRSSTSFYDIENNQP